MTEERLRLHEKAEVRINAIIDTLSQDKGGLADKLKQEDVKDFLISLWVDCSTEVTKELQEKFDKRLKRHCNTIHSLVDELERRQNAEKELQEENAELKEKLEIEQNVRGDWFGKAVTKDRRFTEAKSLLKQLLDSTHKYHARCLGCQRYIETLNEQFIVKAEAFINKE